jgi:hypothetical protein
VNRIRAWDRRQWVGDRGEPPSPAAARPARRRWSRWQLIDEKAVPLDDKSAIGDSALSGWGHGPDGQRWHESSSDRAA